MNVALWIVQGALALVFGGSGVEGDPGSRLFDDGITWGRTSPHGP